MSFGESLALGLTRQLKCPGANDRKHQWEAAARRDCLDGGWLVRLSTLEWYDLVLLLTLPRRLLLYTLFASPKIWIYINIFSSEWYASDLGWLFLSAGCSFEDWQKTFSNYISFVGETSVFLLLSTVKHKSLFSVINYPFPSSFLLSEIYRNYTSATVKTP